MGQEGMSLLLGTPRPRQVGSVLHVVQSLPSTSKLISSFVQQHGVQACGAGNTAPGRAGDAPGAELPGWPLLSPSSA